MSSSAAIVARSNVKVLEGLSDHPEVLAIEKFDSMQALEGFWYSEDDQNAKKLRERVFQADLIVAIVAIEANWGLQTSDKQGTGYERI